MAPSSTANMLPLVGESWQHTAEFGFYQDTYIPVPPVVYYLIRDRKPNPDTVALTPFRKTIEILGSVGSSVGVYYIIKNSRKGAQQSGETDASSSSSGSGSGSGGGSSEPAAAAAPPPPL